MAPSSTVPPTVDEGVRRRFEAAWRAVRPAPIETCLPAGRHPNYRRREGSPAVTDDEDRWSRLIRGLRGGEAEVVREFWERYGPLLHRLAESRLADALRRRVGPEDVVQSVCRTFLRRAQHGAFQLEDAEGLWRLLCAITLTKIREQARFHLRQKRGLAREMDAAPGGDGAPAFDPVAPGPTPAEAAEFADQFEHLLAALDAEERAVVELKLQGCTHEEAAERLGCSERTVRRLLKRAQGRLGRAIEESEA
jgi:RNA polymerase sigma-70 factor (ECF subfamily)